jgi:CRP-like cAMP-binding protein
MSLTAVEAAPLRDVPFFARLPEPDLQRVACRSRLVTFLPGDAIVAKGDRACKMYVVVSGEARVQVGGRFHDLVSGDLLGEMSVLSSRRSSLSKPSRSTVATSRRSSRRTPWWPFRC